MRSYFQIGTLVASLIALSSCATQPEPDGRNESVGYRTGTVEDDYTSKGERGNVSISEIHWAGSVRDGDFRHDPDDVFIELQNTPACILKGWLLTIEFGYHAWPETCAEST